MTYEQYRPGFEAWVVTQNIVKKYNAKLTQNRDGSYKDYRINDRWNSWKSAKATGPDLSALTEIGVRLLTQDNRCTADPVFVVFSKQEIVVDEAYDHDRIIWVTDDGDEIDDRKAARLELLYSKGRESEKYRRVAVKLIDQFETACFTEQGCKDFLKIQGHNLKRPFIYAHSFWRNHEMLGMRELMIKLAQENKTDE